MGPEYSFFRAENVKKLRYSKSFSVKTLLLKVVGITILGLCCRHNECHSAENTLHVRVATKLLRKICTDICCEEMFFDFINPAGSCHQEFMFFAGKLSIVIGKLSRFYDLDSILLIF